MHNQIPEDPHAWYKCLSHPSYFSDAAMLHRSKRRSIKIKGRQTREQSQQARSLVEQRLGKELASKIVDRIYNLISPWDYGIGSPYHLNGQTKAYPRKLRKSDIYNHLAANDMTKRIYYTCKPFRLQDKALCLVTVDIDNDGHASNSISDAAKSVANDLCRKLDLHHIRHLCQPSTNGNGYHVGLILCESARMTDERIRLSLSDLRTSLSRFYQMSGCHEICLKGLNLVRDSTKTARYGTLVRLPQIGSISDAESFIAMTEAPAALQAVAPIFACDENSGSDNGGLEVVERRAAGTTTLDTRGTNQFVSVTRGNPKARMWTAIKHYQRTHGSNPGSPEQLVAYYESLDLHTGAAKPDRHQRAKEVWEHAQAHYDPPHPSLKDWESHLAPLLVGVDLSYTPKRRVRHDEAAVFGYLLGVKLHRSEQAEIPTSFIKHGALALRDNGQVEFSLNDNKKVAKLFRLFKQLGIVTQVRESLRGNDGIAGQCRCYEKGPQWIRSRIVCGHESELQATSSSASLTLGELLAKDLIMEEPVQL